MELILFIYMLVTITVTGHILLTREKDTEGAITSADAARLVEWAKSGGHMPAAPAAPAVPAVPAAPAAPAVPAHDADDNLLPGEDEDHWEDLAEDWEFPEIGKNNHDDWKKLPAIVTGDCRCNRALRGCGRRGKGKQKGGKHIDKKRLRRADTKAHLSLS